MDKRIFSRRLRIARELRGYSLEKISGLLNGSVTKQSLSRYECGVMMPKKPLLASIAEVLGVSIEYFNGTNIKFDQAMLRVSGGETLDDAVAERIESILSYYVERYMAKVHTLRGVLNFSNPLTHCIICAFDDVFDAADELRLSWHCGDGAIPSVIRLLERRGVLVFETDLPDGVMGLSTWADGKYPVILIDMRPEKTTVERLRFTIAHELAHLLLKFGSGVNVEKCCDKFAGAFLVPEPAIKEELGEKRDRIYLEELIDMRNNYGVSVAALVHQAYDLNIISREHYDWWYDVMIKSNVREYGWGNYVFPEVLAKEFRMDVIINNINKRD